MLLFHRWSRTNSAVRSAQCRYSWQSNPAAAHTGGAGAWRCGARMLVQACKLLQAPCRLVLVTQPSSAARAVVKLKTHNSCLSTWAMPIYAQGQVLQAQRLCNDRCCRHKALATAAAAVNKANCPLVQLVLCAWYTGAWLWAHSPKVAGCKQQHQSPHSSIRARAAAQASLNTAPGSPQRCNISLARRWRLQSHTRPSTNTSAKAEL